MGSSLHPLSSSIIHTLSHFPILFTLLRSLPWFQSLHSAFLDLAQEVWLYPARRITISVSMNAGEVWNTFITESLKPWHGSRICHLLHISKQFAAAFRAQRWVSVGLGPRPDVWAACGERMATCSKWQSKVEKSAMSYCKAAFKCCLVWCGKGKEVVQAVICGSHLLSRPTICSCLHLTLKQCFCRVIPVWLREVFLLWIPSNVACLSKHPFTTAAYFSLGWPLWIMYWHFL